MGLLLYYEPDSPPCQAVILVIKQLNLDVEMKIVDLENNEHLTPEYLRINPLHQVPTLDDGGFYIGDSHAIISYLAADTDLMSCDKRILARINQFLFFDFELFRVIGEIGIPLYYDSAHEPSQKALAILHEKLTALESILKCRAFVAGEFPSIADFSILATFSALYHCPINLSKYKAILNWFEKCKETFIGYADIEEESKNALGNFLKSKGIELVLKL